MDIITQSRALDLIYKMFFLGRAGFAPAGYIPAKTGLQACESEPYFKKSSPERHGISSKLILDFYRALEESEDANVHTVTILADGEIVSAACAKPYSRHRWNLSYSFSKTVTALAIGILVGDGRLSLDAPVYKLLPHDTPAVLSPRMKSITVRHLLNMTSGVTFNELGVISDEYWVRAFFESAVKFEPGTQFAYNSMNSYMLAAVVHEITGEGLVEFLTPRLFEPMGIREIFWQKCPRGIEQGGMGLYITPEDMAKIGYLLLCGGAWEGAQLVPCDFVRDMTEMHMETPENAGEFNYGYHTWVARRGGAFLANGLFGQNVYVTSSGLVIAITAGNSEMFQSGEMMKLVTKYFGALADIRLRRLPSPARLIRLRRAEQHFWERRSWIGLPAKKAPEIPEEWSLVAGKRYIFDKNNIGILPLTVRVVNGNHSTGLTELAFSSRDGAPALLFREGEAEYTVKIGFRRHEVSVLGMNGEYYRVSAIGRFVRDDDYRRVLKLELAFDETPSTRRIKIILEKSRLVLSFSETPSERLIDEYIASMNVSLPAKQTGRMAKLLPRIDAKPDMSLLSERVLKTFAPTVIAKEKTEKEQNEQPTVAENGEDDGDEDLSL